ncbi:MAG: hypothetical protein PHI88_00335 [Candidatus Pacebacteria bacterium]|nr:hypothetical protein [Candidatus Paceibacterota bacterium]
MRRQKIGIIMIVIGVLGYIYNPLMDAGSNCVLDGGCGFGSAMPRIPYFLIPIFLIILIIGIILAVIKEKNHGKNEN